MIFKFGLLMDPPTTTAQMHKVGVRNGRPYFYDPPEVKKTKSKLLAYLAAHRPKEKLKGALRLKTQWMYQIKGDHKHGEYRISKPDTDNLQKLLKDCMTELGFWEDDAQVAEEHVAKIWVENYPGIFIEVEELNER